MGDRKVLRGVCVKSFLAHDVKDATDDFFFGRQIMMWVVSVARAPVL